MPSQATWFTALGQPIKIGPTEEYSPGAGEVLVRNRAVAINPVDFKQQDYGLLIDTYPRALGCDTAGEVVKVGQGVSNVKAGDRVIGHCMNLLKPHPQYAAFQDYTVVPVDRVAKLPSNLSFAEGAVLPLAVSTAAAGLYGSNGDGFLGLPLPTVEGQPEQDVIVVYGSSSSVGSAAVQLAAHSGAKVIAIASEKNFGLSRDAGAIDVFDYKDPEVVAKVVAAVKKTGLRFAGVYDAIALEGQSFTITVPILEELGGGVLAVAVGPPKSLPASIKAGSIYATSPVNLPVWADFVGQALEQGTLKPLPAPNMIGKGLEHIQEGIDLSRKGVSGSKIVVEL